MWCWSKIVKLRWQTFWNWPRTKSIWLSGSYIWCFVTLRDGPLPSNELTRSNILFSPKISWLEQSFLRWRDQRSKYKTSKIKYYYNKWLQNYKGKISRQRIVVSESRSFYADTNDIIFGWLAASYHKTVSQWSYACFHSTRDVLIRRKRR